MARVHPSIPISSLAGRMWFFPGSPSWKSESDRVEKPRCRLRSRARRPTVANKGESDRSTGNLQVVSIPRSGEGNVRRLTFRKDAVDFRLFFRELQAEIPGFRRGAGPQPGFFPMYKGHDAAIRFRGHPVWTAKHRKLLVKAKHTPASFPEWATIPDVRAS